MIMKNLNISILLSLLSINSVFAAKTQSEMTVSVVVLSSCHVNTINNSKNRDLDIKVVSQCIHNNDSYITVQNIDQIKENNQYVLNNKNNISINRKNEEYYIQLQSKHSPQDADKVLVTINY